MNTVNPELVLKAAEMVRNDIVWIITSTGWVAMDEEMNGVFFPQCDKEDAHALMLALMKEENGSWFFGREYMKPDKRYWAVSSPKAFKVFDESFPLLLCKCVSAMTGVAVYETNTIS